MNDCVLVILVVSLATTTLIASSPRLRQVRYTRLSRVHLLLWVVAFFFVLPLVLFIALLPFEDVAASRKVRELIDDAGRHAASSPNLREKWHSAFDKRPRGMQGRLDLSAEDVLVRRDVEHYFVLPSFPCLQARTVGIPMIAGYNLLKVLCSPFPDFRLPGLNTNPGGTPFTVNGYLWDMRGYFASWASNPPVSSQQCQ